MVVHGREGLSHVWVQCASRDDIKDGELGHGFRMVKRHAMRHTPATVVSDDGEFLEAKLLHDLDLVLRGRTFQ